MHDRKKIKILITGGTGMVGKNFIENKQAKNYFILSPTRKELNLFNIDKINMYLLQHKPDFIVHAAGRVGGIQANIKDSFLFLLENADMGRNLIVAALNQNINKIINLSSSCVYPKNMDVELDEDFILKGSLEPTNEGYSIAKIFVQKLCNYINAEHTDKFYKTIIPCNLFGKYDDFSLDSGHLLPNIINKIYYAKINDKNKVTIWGDGSVRREFMYVDDFIDFLFYAIKYFSKMPEVINVGIGKDYSVLDYYNLVAKCLDWKGTFEFDKTKPVGQKQKRVSIKRLQKFGWKCKTPILKSTKETIKYYIESHVDAL